MCIHVTWRELTQILAGSSGPLPKAKLVEFARPFATQAELAEMLRRCPRLVPHLPEHMPPRRIGYEAEGCTETTYLRRVGS